METGYEKPDKKACLWVNNITFKWIASFECYFFLLKILKLVRSLRTNFYMLNSVTFLAVLSSETILTDAFKSIICIVCLTSACILARIRWARWLKRYKHEIINNGN